MIEKIKKTAPFIAMAGGFFFWLGSTKFADKDINQTEHQEIKTSIIEFKKDIEYIKLGIDDLKKTAIDDKVTLK